MRGFGVMLLAVAFFSARHFMRSGWPLHHADPLLVGAAAAPLPHRLRLQGLGLAAAVPRSTNAPRPAARLRRRRSLRRRHRAPRPDRRRGSHRDRQALPGHARGPRHGRAEPARRSASSTTPPGAAGFGRRSRMRSSCSVAPASWSSPSRESLAALVVAFLPKFAGMRRVTRYRIGRWLASHTHCTKESGAACSSSPSPGRCAARQSSCS